MGFFTSCCTLAAVTAASTIACYGYTLYARVIEPTNPGLADLHMFIYFVALWSFRGVYTQQTFALAYNIGIWKGSDPPLVRTSAQFYKAQLLAGGESSIHFDQIATEPCEPPTSTVVSKKKMRALDPFGAGWLVLYQLTMVSQLLHLAWYTSVVSNNFTVSDRRQYLNGWDTPQHMQTYWTIAGYIFLLGITPVVFRTRILRNDPTNITHKTSILGFLILLPGSMSWPLVLLGINWAPFVMLAFVLLAIVYHIGQAIYFNRAGKIVWLTRNFDVLFGVYLIIWAFKAFAGAITSTVTSYPVLAPYQYWIMLLSRAFLGMIVFIIEQMARTVYGTNDTWLLFGYKFIEDLTVTWLTMQSDASAPSVARAAAFNFAILFLRESGVIEDLYFAYCHGIPLGHTYDWTRSICAPAKPGTTSSLPSLAKPGTMSSLPSLARSGGQTLLLPPQALDSRVLAWIELLREQIQRTEQCAHSRVATVVALGLALIMNSVVDWVGPEAAYPWHGQVALLLAVCASFLAAQTLLSMFISWKAAGLNQQRRRWKRQQRKTPKRDGSPALAPEEWPRLSLWKTDFRRSTSPSMVVVLVLFAISTQFQPY